MLNQIIQLQFNGTDQPLELRLLKYADCAQNSEASSRREAASGLFIQQRQIGPQLLREENCFALSRTKRRSYLYILCRTKITYEAGMYPCGCGNFRSARPSTAFADYFPVNSLRNQNFLI